MIRMLLSDAAQLLGCTGHDGNRSFRGITTDSRRVEAGMLFAALVGGRSDGHDFVAAAVDAGAAAVLVSKPLDRSFPQLVVDDVLRALGTLASSWRSVVEPCVVGITGSNGKTTTKEMVRNILVGNATVLSTSGNQNNELGLPLTLFRLNCNDRFAVLEMGASKAGDIRYLSQIAPPHVGLVCNVGPAHLLGFGDEEGVARAKGEMFAALPADGFAVINADEPWSVLWQKMSTANNTITFGRQDSCHVHPVYYEQGCLMVTPGGDFPLQLALPGDHNVQNALAATAVCLALDVPLDQIRHGLEITQPVPGRLNRVHADAGWTVIDDTYNANPASLYAALQVLARERGEPWLVLGDMKELGRNSRKMHAEMGQAAQALGVRRLFAIGKVTPATVEAFGAGGRHFKDIETLVHALCSELQPGVACLVKGSRSMGMEQVVRAISSPCDIREAG